MEFSLRARALSSIGVSFTSWFIMYWYSHFNFVNPLFKESLQTPSLAIRLMVILQWVTLATILSLGVLCWKRPSLNRWFPAFEITATGLAIIWPLLVLFAWQIERLPFVDLRGIH
jgi:hypothetical protein